MRLRIASSQALHPSFCPFGAKAQSRRCSSLPHQTHFVGLCWGPRDLFCRKFVCKTLKYTKYSCGFTPFSDEKSLVRLSCRVVRRCLFIILRNGKAAVKIRTYLPLPKKTAGTKCCVFRTREGDHPGHCRDHHPGRRRIHRSQEW